MPRILNDEKLQQQFDRDGYIVVPFLNDAQVKELTALFYELHKEVPASFYSTTFNASAEFKQRITAKAEEVYGAQVDGMFTGIKKLGSSYLCKAPGVNTQMPVHQDWTVVDESKYQSVTIWIPLVDTDERNGAIKVLPGSHKFTQTLRTPNLPGEYTNVQNEIWDAMELVPMRAGEAFIFNHAVLHASTPNISGSQRLAITYGLTQKEAQLQLYYLNGTKLERYLMPDDMFQRYYNIGERPLFGEKVEEFAYPVKQVSSLKLHYFMNKAKRARKMKPLFKDAAVQEFFETNGYVKLPLINEDEVKLLLNYYQTLALKDEAGFGFHISMDTKDKTLLPKILEKIYEVALPKLSAHFQNARPFVGSFVIKEKNPLGVVPVHQDWSFVDHEDEYCSVTCWCPLVDTNLDNGALGVMKGSHNYLGSYRPSPSPQVPSPIAEHMFTIFPYLQLEEMKAGEVLIFDNRTFHGSPPNASEGARIAFGIGFTQADAQLTHYYLKPDGNKDKVFKYKVDSDFFLKYNNPALSKMYDKGELIQGYEVVGELPYVLPKFTAEELVELIKDTGNQYNVPMCEKLAALFSYHMDGSKKQTETTAVNEPAPQQQEQKTEPVKEPYVWVDDRSFFEKYTPLNIAREIKKRLVA